METSHHAVVPFSSTGETGMINAVRADLNEKPQRASVNFPGRWKGHDPMVEYYSLFIIKYQYIFVEDYTKPHKKVNLFTFLANPQFRSLQSGNFDPRRGG